MKKFLSLVLALVMTMSLVIISAGAKGFADDSKITYKEAVDVMSAVKVVDGYADGAFQPTTALTRGAAAKIICNMILGPTTAEALIADAAPFKDVPADHVFAGYIAYCSQQGIINGYADGTFRPAGTLTGYSFMKMLLGALGYDGSVEGFTGANWSIQVAKLAKNLKLDKGNDAFVGSAAVTREEACLYAFNTMKATMVKYSNKTEVTTGDVTVSLTGNRYEVAGDPDDSYDGCKDAKDPSKEDETLQFCEEYFPKLKLAEGKTDDYGRPAHQWKNDKSKVGTYVDSAVLTYTDKVKGTVLADDLDDADVDVYNDKDAASIVVYRNGVEKQTITDTKKVGDLQKILDSTKDVAGTGKGIVVELFASDDVLNRIVIVNTYLAEVKDITEDKTTTKSVDERGLELAYTDANGAAVTVAADCDTIGFDDVYENVEKGDMILVVPKGDNTASTYALEVAMPETVEGVMTYASSSSVKVEGTSYPISALVSKTFTPDEDPVIIYLDANGYVVGSTAKNSTDDKALGVVKVFNGLNADGELVAKAKVVFSDGSTETVELAKTGDKAVAGQMYTYEKVKGAYKLTDAAAATASVVKGGTYEVAKATLSKSAKSLAVYSTERTYFAADVQFIYVDGANNKIAVKSGVQKIETATDVVVVIDNDGKICTVFVPGKAANTVTDADSLIFIAKETGTVIAKDADDEYVTYYTYDAYVDGKKVEDFYATTTGEATKAFFTSEKDEDTGAYILDGNDYVDTTEDLKVDKGTLTSTSAIVNDNVLVIGSSEYGIGAAKIADNSTDIDSISGIKTALKNGLKVELTVLYDKDSLDVTYVYITDVAE